MNLYNYFFVERLSASRKYVAYIGLTSMFLSLFVPWGYGISNVFEWRNMSDAGTLFQNIFLPSILVGYVFCYFNRNLVLVIGLGIFTLYWLPTGYTKSFSGAAAAFNFYFTYGPILFNLGFGTIILNHFFPESKFSDRIVSKVDPYLKKIVAKVKR